MNITATDRSALIRLASSLPQGSAERKAILAGLKEDNARYERVRQQLKRAADILVMAHKTALKIPEFDSKGVRKLMLDTQRFYESMSA